MSVLPAGLLHEVLGRPLEGPFPEGTKKMLFGMGCFWGAEKLMWTQPGVWVTAVGFAGGSVPNPTYKQVCTSTTGHAEVVLVVYDPVVTTEESLMKVFLEGHDPTQGMRQGNDVGPQYRSMVVCYEERQLEVANKALETYAKELAGAGYGPITTEVLMGAPFWYAEVEHQQYLAKNPWGYCGHGGTGIACPSLAI